MLCTHPPAAAQYRYEYNVEYPGTLVAHWNVNSQTECERLCNTNPLCRSYTWAPGIRVCGLRPCAPTGKSFTYTGATVGEGFRQGYAVGLRTLRACLSQLSAP